MKIKYYIVHDILIKVTKNNNTDRFEIHRLVDRNSLTWERTYNIDGDTMQIVIKQIKANYVGTNLDKAFEKLNRKLLMYHV